VDNKDRIADLHDVWIKVDGDRQQAGVLLGDRVVVQVVAAAAQYLIG
jgi:hypothetical protein